MLKICVDTTQRILTIDYLLIPNLLAVLVQEVSQLVIVLTIALFFMYSFNMFSFTFHPQTSLPETVSTGGLFCYMIQIGNNGFATPSIELELFLVLENKNDR